MLICYWRPGGRCDDRIVHGSDSFSGTSFLRIWLRISNTCWIWITQRCRVQKQPAEPIERERESASKSGSRSTFFFGKTKASRRKLANHVELDGRHPVPSPLFKLVLTPPRILTSLPPSGRARAASPSGKRRCQPPSSQCRTRTQAPGPGGVVRKPARGGGRSDFPA
jgi:hypothetical protein